MTPNPPTLDPIRPNAGIEIAYQRRLEALIEEMQRSLVWWITAAYRASPPKMAMDAVPSKTLDKLLKRLGKYWVRRFANVAPSIAEYFARKVYKYADASLETSLKKHGLGMTFELTPVMNDVIQSTVSANAALITNIAQEHVADVQELVMRTFQQGGNLKNLTDELQHRYQMTKKRAVTISLDQNRKYVSALTRARQKQIGVTQAIWRHSHGGKEPRPSHVNAGKENLVYDIDKGAFLDGEWVWPGSAYGCKCYAKSIIPGLVIKEKLTYGT